jgi:hypothetical protein
MAGTTTVSARPTPLKAIMLRGSTAPMINERTAWLRMVGPPVEQ